MIRNSIHIILILSTFCSSTGIWLPYFFCTGHNYNITSDYNHEDKDINTKDIECSTKSNDCDDGPCDDNCCDSKIKYFKIDQNLFIKDFNFEDIEINTIHGPRIQESEFIVLGILEASTKHDRYKPPLIVNNIVILYQNVLC